MFSWDFTPFFRPNADDIYEQSIAYYSDEKIKKTTENKKKSNKQGKHLKYVEYIHII